MTTYSEHSSARSNSDQLAGVVDTRTLWTGGVITAVIVGGLTIVGFLLVEGILRYPLLGDRASGVVQQATMIGYAAWAVLVALLATAAMHVLLVTTPRPRWFFRWLGGIGTAIAVLVPLTQHLAAPMATATVNLMLGLAIIGLVHSTTAASLRPRHLTQAEITPTHSSRRRLIPRRRQEQIIAP
jgi:hypothetical protein